jgi:hypothetical protein
MIFDHVEDASVSSLSAQGNTQAESTLRFIDSRDVLFFLSVIVFSLFTTGVIVRAHRAG